MKKHKWKFKAGDIIYNDKTKKEMCVIARFSANLVGYFGKPENPIYALKETKKLACIVERDQVTVEKNFEERKK